MRDYGNYGVRRVQIPNAAQFSKFRDRGIHATNDNSASLVLAAGLALSEHRPAASLIMAMARALTAVRTGVLSHLRVQASLTATQHQAGPTAWQSVRGFAGTYLDKNEVTERILNVVKNFEKVDQSKVSPRAP